jgi:Ca2+/Na+ antiporter
MFFKEFLVSLAVALLVCVIFALVTRSSVRRTGFGWFFLFVFIATWAGGVWLRPFGPTWGEIRWLQFLIVGLLVALLFALFAPLKAPRGRHETLAQLQAIARQKEVQKATYVTLGIVFWVVLVILVAAIVIRYVGR